MPTGNTTGLRVAVLHSGGLLQWQADALAHIADRRAAEPVLVLIDDSKEGRPKRTTAKSGRVLPWSGKVHALEPAVMPKAWENVPRWTIALTKGVALAQELQDQLAVHAPDVLICFGDRPAPRALVRLVKHGALTFHFGPHKETPGAIPGLHEAIGGSPLTQAALVHRTADHLHDGILREAVLGTMDEVSDVAASVLAHALRWPADVLLDLSFTGSMPHRGPWNSKALRSPKAPGRLQITAFQLRRWAAKLRFLHRPLLEQQAGWNIGVLSQPISTLLDPDASRGVRWLPAPSESGARTTPFGYVHKKALNVLYAKSDVEKQSTSIARLRPRPDNVLKRSRSMLDIGRSLAYPYVLAHDGRIMVVLDHPTEERVVLYRVNEANDGLERVADILAEPLVGATVFAHGGRWWLMGTKAPQADAVLHAYWSDRLEGPYRPHRLNPVKVDIRSSRPGGTPFIHGSTLWRPAQDRTPGQDVRVVFNRIVELDVDRFVEEPVEHLAPFAHTAYTRGTRTVSAVGDITLVDGLRDRNPLPKRKKKPSKRRRSRPNKNQDG